MPEKVFVITGVNKGFGLSLLKAVVARGLTAEGVSRSSKSPQVPTTCTFTQLDCSNAEDTANFWTQFHEKYGSEVSVTLINNAGVYIKKSFLKTDFGDFKDVIENNFYSAVNMTKGLVSVYPKATIVNIVSTTGHKGAVVKADHALKSAYGASKAAESVFFTALQDEFRNTNYRIVNLHPKNINTWSDEPEPDTIFPDELARWVIDTSLLAGSFVISDCDILPYTETE